MHFNVETGWKSKTLGSLASCSALLLSLLFISFFFFSKSVAFANSNKGKADPDYQSLSLEDCLTLAKQYNPALGGAKEKIRELTAEYRAARSRFFPSLPFLPIMNGLSRTYCRREVLRPLHPRISIRNLKIIVIYGALSRFH